MYKDCQYESCLREVREFTNLNYIVKKLKDLDYLKAILFNREQFLSFDFFNKPLVADNSVKVNKIINQIHYDQFDISTGEKLQLIKNYYNNINSENINNKDLKILEFIDTDFIQSLIGYKYLSNNIL